MSKEFIVKQISDFLIFLGIRKPKKLQMAVFKSRKVLLYPIFPCLYLLSFIQTTIYGIWDLTPEINQIKNRKI